jgi:hypothetical protein
VLSDLVTIFNGSIFTNVHLTELFESARVSLDTKMSISVIFIAFTQRNIVAFLVIFNTGHVCTGKFVV